MQIKINEREIRLKPDEVASAKKVVSRFLDEIRRQSWNFQQPTYYFTVLIVMHLISQEALDNMNPDSLAKIMDAFSESGLKEPPAG